MQVNRALGNQNVAIGAASAQSNTMRTISGDAGHQAVLLITNVACFIAIGSNPTADANGIQLLPGQPALLLEIMADEKVAVIQQAAAGILSVVPVRVESV
jgi:hypothetical protein